MKEKKWLSMSLDKDGPKTLITKAMIGVRHLKPEFRAIGSLKAIRIGTYPLETPKARKLSHIWNAQHLKKQTKFRLFPLQNKNK